MKETPRLVNMAQHLVISASAGSGKTYQLAHRYIGLLLRGEAPDRIVALTFSRKAASCSSVISCFASELRRLPSPSISGTAPP